MYSRFINGLNVHSNIQLDRKILANLAANEPYSFKSVIDEVSLQSGLVEIAKRKPIVAEMQSISYADALQQGRIVDEKRRKDEVMNVIKEPDAILYGLRFPEKDAKTDADFMRISFREEDEKFIEDQKRQTLTEKEQKKLPREILTDDWKEDMSLYKHKRKP